MEITKLSSKGQVVIPERVRDGLDVGTAFAVRRKKNLIILKKLDGLTAEEKEELQEIEKTWKEIDEGKCESYTTEEFFKELNTW